MKRVIYLLFIISLCLSLSSCKVPSFGTTNNVEVDFGNSTFYSEVEIKSATEAVLTKFRDFAGCDLLRLWYDEEMSDRIIQIDMSSGGMNAIKSSGAEPENVIILFSDFYAGPSSGGGGFNPDFKYTNWMWILIRDSKNEEWKIVAWGY
jgi:hypothetical protein